MKTSKKAILILSTLLLKILIKSFILSLKALNQNDICLKFKFNKVIIDFLVIII
jgi:hypothetical protein